MYNDIKLNSEQATWLFKIREHQNFWNSLADEDKTMIHLILSSRDYNINLKGKIDDVRDKWIRYVKLTNHKDI